MRRRNRRQHLITIQQDTSDEGDQSQTWSDFVTEFARFEEPGGMQNFRGDDVNETTSATFRIIKREGVTPKMRVQYIDKSFSTPVTRNFEIERISEDRQKNKAEMILHCNEDRN